MRVAALVMLVSAAALGGALGAAHGTWQATPPVDDEAFVRGVALGLFATDSEWDYGPLVDEIRARGATDVLVVVNAYQSNRFASDIAPRLGHSPSEATVARTLSQVQRAGMRAALMPVVRLRTRASHDWRGVIIPADGLDAWFEAYRRFVLPLARIAEDAGAKRFVVGSELGSLEPYDEHWRALISEVRERFSRTLTYSANWDRSHAVEFWDALDEVGLTAYFPLANEGEPTSSDALAHAWRTPRAEIDALARRVGKPVLITEIGYASQRSAADRPWDDTSVAAVDLRLQQRLYRGFCDAFAQAPRVSGYYVWNWFGFGGPRDAGFTPRGKPAAHELAKCFARPRPTGAHAGNPS
jgi:Holliday junction resolvase-like predicted endonuclease